ncbi:integrase, catalytic region, zinc finger, CCHC-type containing protein [Tanacetum coccineum]
MSTTSAHQQALADAGSETRPTMLERDYDDDYQGETFSDDQEDILTSAMMLLARAITQRYSTPTNNQLHTSSNTWNQAFVQADRDSKYFMEQMLLAKKDEAEVILSNKHNDFLLADADQMEEIEELSANICLMARIQQATTDSDEGPNYDYAFIGEVQTPSTSFMNLLVSNSDHEQTYHEQPEIVNSTNGDDQINSDIIFDDPNVKINDGNVDHDKNAYDQHDNELELLARNTYKEAEKQLTLAKKEFPEEVQDMINVFESMESNLDATLKQNEIKHDVESCVLTCSDFMNINLHDEIEKVKMESIDVQENLLKRINILENDFQRKRENVKLEYQKLFDSIKKTQTQPQREMDELIENVNQKTYAYGDTEGVTSVRRSPSRSSSSKNSVLSNTRNQSKDVEVHVKTNKNTNVTSQKNVVKTKNIVANIDVKNALKAKDVLCVSYDKNMLTSCHDKCLAKYKLSVHSKVRRALFTTPGTVKSKSLNTTPIVAKTRFVVVTPLSEKNKGYSASRSTSLFVQENTLRNYMRTQVIQIVLWIVDSGCSKHMTGNLKLLKNFIEKFMGTVRFGNDHFAAITGYDNYVHGKVTTCHVCYVEGLGHNLFSVGQLCDGDLEVTFRSKTSPEFLWAEAISTACFTQNRSLIHARYNKTPYELIQDRKPNVQYFHVFGSLCYPSNDCEDLGKTKPKADIGIFIGYSESSRGFQIYNRRTSNIMETIHVKFDELTAMASEHNLDNLFGPMYEKYFEKRSPEVSINSAAQTTLNNEDTYSSSSIIIEDKILPLVSSSEEQISPISNDVVVELVQEDSTDLDENTLITPYNSSMFEEAESSSTAADPSNMHEFNQVQRSTHTWTKAHPLEQVIGDPSKPVMTRSRLNTDAEMCMYALTMSTTEPKNIKEEMLDNN